MCNEPATQLLELGQRFHTLLEDIVPLHLFFPNDPDLEKFTDWSLSALKCGGVIKIMKDCVRGIQKNLDFLAIEVREGLSFLWLEVALLVGRIEKELNCLSIEWINKALTLIYFANGITWNMVRIFVGSNPPLNEQYVFVKPIEMLLKICKYPTIDDQLLDISKLLTQVTLGINRLL